MGAIFSCQSSEMKARDLISVAELALNFQNSQQKGLSRAQKGRLQRQEEYLAVRYQQAELDRFAAIKHKQDVEKQIELDRALALQIMQQEQQIRPPQAADRRLAFGPSSFQKNNFTSHPVCRCGSQFCSICGWY